MWKSFCAGIDGDVAHATESRRLEQHVALLARRQLDHTFDKVFRSEAQRWAWRNSHHAKPAPPRPPLPILRDHTGLISTWRFFPNDSLITPSGLRSFVVRRRCSSCST